MNNKSRLPIATLLLAFTILFSGCKKDEEEELEPATNNSSTSYTITVGVFLEDGGTYTDQDKDLVFVNQADCQSWSRNCTR